MIVRATVDRTVTLRAREDLHRNIEWWEKRVPFTTLRIRRSGPRMFVWLGVVPSVDIPALPPESEDLYRVTL